MPVRFMGPPMPSWQDGLARSAHESQAPEQWDRLLALWMPALGPTGQQLRDVSGWGMNLAMQGRASNLVWSSGLMGWGYNCDGTTDYATLDDQDRIRPTHALTLIAWFEPSIGDNDNDILLCWDGGSVDTWELSWKDTGSGRGLRGTVKGVSGTANLQEASWTPTAGVYHGIVTFQLGTARLYRDGVERDSAGSLGNTIDYGVFGTEIGIMADPGGAKQHLFGKLYKAAIYAKAFTAAEVWEEYQDPWAVVRLRVPTVFRAAVAGGTDHSLSLSEALALKDTPLRQGDWQRTLPETLALQDTPSRQVPYLRQPAETLALVDSSARQGTWLRDPAETLALVDTPLRQGDWLRDPTETVALQDVPSRQGTWLRDPSETLALTEAIVRLAPTSRVVPETLALVDTPARQVPHLRQITTTVALVDNPIREQVWRRSLSTPLALNTPLVPLRQGDWQRAFADPMALVDSGGVSRLVTHFRVTTDSTMALADGGASRQGDWQRLDSSTLALVDDPTLSKGVTYLVSVSEALALVDSVGRQVAVERIISSTVGLSDAPTRSAQASRSLSEALGLGDLTQRVVAYARAPSEALGASDAITRQVTTARALSETLALVDSPTLVNTTTLVAGPYYVGAAEVYVAYAAAGQLGDVGRAVVGEARSTGSEG